MLALSDVPFKLRYILKSNHANRFKIYDTLCKNDYLGYLPLRYIVLHNEQFL